MEKIFKHLHELLDESKKYQKITGWLLILMMIFGISGVLIFWIPSFLFAFPLFLFVFIIQNHYMQKWGKILGECKGILFVLDEVSDDQKTKKEHAG